VAPVTAGEINYFPQSMLANVQYVPAVQVRLMLISPRKQGKSPCPLVT
jgi:hypothetical protein